MFTLTETVGLFTLDRSREEKQIRSDVYRHRTDVFFLPLMFSLMSINQIESFQL